MARIDTMTYNVTNNQLGGNRAWSNLGNIQNETSSVATSNHTLSTHEATGFCIRLEELRYRNDNITNHPLKHIYNDYDWKLDGIECKIKRRAQNNKWDVYDEKVLFWDTALNAFLSDNKSLPNKWETSLTEVVYGGPNDRWGLTEKGIYPSSGLPLIDVRIAPDYNTRMVFLKQTHEFQFKHVIDGKTSSSFGVEVQYVKFSIFFTVNDIKYKVDSSNNSSPEIFVYDGTNWVETTHIRIYDPSHSNAAYEGNWRTIYY